MTKKNPNAVVCVLGLGVTSHLHFVNSCYGDAAEWVADQCQ